MKLQPRGRTLECLECGESCCQYCHIKGVCPACAAVRSGVMDLVEDVIAGYRPRTGERCGRCGDTLDQDEMLTPCVKCGVPCCGECVGGIGSTCTFCQER